MYSFHNFARRTGSVSCSAALRRRRATISLSLPAEIFCATAPLPPAPEADRLDLRTKVERAVPVVVPLAIDDCDAAVDAVAAAEVEEVAVPEFVAIAITPPAGAPPPDRASSI